MSVCVRPYCARRWISNITLLATLFLFACGDGYPPCDPEGDSDTVIFGPSPSPLPGPGGPGDPPDWADAPTKYGTNEEGQVCTCGPYQPGCTTDPNGVPEDEFGETPSLPDICGKNCAPNNSADANTSGSDTNNQQVQGFSASIFKFVTFIPDDGQDEGGGWQEAIATLKFVRWTEVFPEYWSCSVKIGMPLRASGYGAITPGDAALKTSDVATAAGGKLKPFDYPSGIFCTKLPGEMLLIFKTSYPLLGARVN